MLGLILLFTCSTLVLGKDACYKDGLCLGHLIEVQESGPDNEFNSIAQCVEKCKTVEKCKFASFNSKHHTCTLSKACHQVVLKESNYTHSNVDCRPKIHKILIVGGTEEPDPNIEILSLEGVELTCSISDTIGNRFAAVHGLVNNLPTICGGQYPNGSISDSCFQLVNNTFISIDNLGTGVSRAAFAKYEDSIIITGGLGGDPAESLDLIQVADDTSIQWKLQESLAEHCMALIPKTDTYYLMGGQNEGVILDKTYSCILGDDLYCLEREELQTAVPRINHMCGTMDKDGKRYVVVVGGVSSSGETLTYCEYNHFPDPGWQRCEDLPEPLESGQLINDPVTGDLLLLGGNNGNHDQNTIYRLSDINGEWIRQDQTMKVGRSAFSAMFVPDGTIDCDKSMFKHDEL